MALKLIKPRLRRRSALLCSCVLFFLLISNGGYCLPASRLLLKAHRSKAKRQREFFIKELNTFSTTNLSCFLQHFILITCFLRRSIQTTFLSSHRVLSLSNPSLTVTTTSSRPCFYCVWSRVIVRICYRNKVFTSNCVCVYVRARGRDYETDS